MRISDWSSDVCSSDLERELLALRGKPERVLDTANSIQKLGRQPIGEQLEGKVRERVAELRSFPVEERVGARLGRIQARGTEPLTPLDPHARTALGRVSTETDTHILHDSHQGAGKR